MSTIKKALKIHKDHDEWFDLVRAMLPTIIHNKALVADILIDRAEYEAAESNKVLHPDSKVTFMDKLIPIMDSLNISFTTNPYPCDREF